MAEEQSLGSFGDELKKKLDLSADQWIRASDVLNKFANQINTTFGQGRQRMIELNQSIADAVPNVNRLGGQIEDVASTISQIAEASRRNVVASSKDIEQLYAATKALGMSVGEIESLSNSFLDVGVGIEKIGEELDKSMLYVRSIGGNSKQVMEDVRKSMDQMNRFQFEGGVVGLTKMAAQASMLRFNMNETFRLADRVLDPEGAVETAAAFQRLGVAAGNLADPFQLMNQSINDPSGLQNSLADVAKQFTYFDEKTKTFKINPQGVLTLRELEKQTGVSAAEMSKMGLAAAELDKRLSAVSAAGLKISSEEDKQFLANIAKLGDKGTYEVTLKDGTKKELAELQQGEFDELIKQQKEGPKTLEDVARAQLSTSEVLRNDVSAIRNKILGGVVSAPQIVDAREQVRSITEKTLGELSKLGGTEDVRNEVKTLFSTIDSALKDISAGKGGIETTQKVLNKFADQMESIKTRFTNGIDTTMKKVGEQESAKSGAIEQFFGKSILATRDYIEKINPKKTESLSLLEGTEKSELSKGVKTTTLNESFSKSDVNIGGKVSIDINLPNNFNQLDKEQQQKIIDEIFNSQKFQQYIMNLTQNKNQTKQPVSSTYGGTS